MPSFSARVVRFVIRWIIGRKSVSSSAEKTRETMRSLYLRPQSFSPPKSLGHGISIDRIDLNDWPLYRVSASGSDSSSKSSETRAAMVYIHGGAFYREILGPHWKFLAQ